MSHTIYRFPHLFLTISSGLAIALWTGQPGLAQSLNTPAPKGPANESDHIDKILSSLNQDSEFNPMRQVTSVTQLRDIKPTDWAFQALQSLVERYGCIAGYPDGTFRGNRAMTRYEFAAGLNACLDRVNELIASATADLVNKEDLAVLQRLQEEFQAELATLRGRVDALEAKTARLEAQQFSTTTKLSGELIATVAGAIGEAPTGDDASTTLNSRLRLNLLTSFTGKDLLITGLQTHNFPGSNGGIARTLGYGDVIFGEASHVRLGAEPQFPSVNPQDLSVIGSNSVNLYKLLYIFPVGKVTAFVGSKAEVSDAFPSILPFADEGQGSISRFGTLPASHRVSGGTSGMGLASAAGLIWPISDALDLRVLYGSVNASLANNQGLSGGTPLGAGLFGGSYVAATQLTVKPSKSLTFGLNYAYSYHQINILGTGLSQSDIGAILFPAASVGEIAGEGIRMNTFGLSVAYNLSPKLTLAGTATYIASELVDVNASTNFLSWMAGVHFKDLFRQGNTAGLLFGQPLKRTSVGGSAIKPEDATPYHLEGYYNFKVSDNISLTPGVVAIFNPEGFDDRETVIMPVVRSTFKF